MYLHMKFAYWSGKFGTNFGETQVKRTLPTWSKGVLRRSYHPIVYSFIWAEVSVAGVYSRNQSTSAAS